MPLDYPDLVEQQPASARFHLFGDRADPAYRDEAPVDGIDDRRQMVLQELGARFGPILVQNSTSLPMDFRRFMETSRSFNLHVDTWDLAGHPQSLLKSDSVDLLALVEDPCQDGRFSAAGDCLLLDLLRRFDPRDPDYAFLAPRRIGPAGRRFVVAYFDFPGEGPDSWRAEFTDEFSRMLPLRYRDFLKTYVHPFIREVASPLHGVLGYEFVLQYYFFYPTNDGGNNHEGDWEHLNVTIAPRSSVTELLTAEQVRGILAAGAAYGAAVDDPLVIRTLDYYFHEQVYRLDFAAPNVYAPRDAWRAEVDRAVAERKGQHAIWKWQRRSVYWDDEETVLNTHPVGFIGADNKGLDQALTSPGGRNRDSHGTYPFPGLFKDIGPGGATEQISSRFDHRRYWRRHGGDISGAGQEEFGRGRAVPYTTIARIEVWPDWERIVEPVFADPAARRDWFWMIVPVRWGYPATRSPFAGIVAHAETGNLAPPGPMFQPHWNRVYDEGGSHPYVPHRFATLFPLGLQDSFDNSWGYLNLTLPLLSTLPPVDLAWRLGALPLRMVLQTNEPTYFPSETIPSRFVGLTGGVARLSYGDDVAALLVNGESGLDALVQVSLRAPDGIAETREDVASPMAAWWRASFYLGRSFTTQNTLTHARSGVGLVVLPVNGDEFRMDSQLNFWEFQSSFRFDLMHGNLRPYLKAGYGWTWYRLEEIGIGGELLEPNRGEWIHRPSFKTLGDMLPNSWHAGLGLEIILVSSVAPVPSGLDASLVLEAGHSQNSLGLDDWLRLLSTTDIRNGIVEDARFKRWILSAGLNIGF